MEPKQVTLRTAVEIYQALNLLSQRALPSYEAELKIASLSRQFRAYYDDFEERRIRLIEAADRVSDNNGVLVPVDQPALELEVRALQSTFITITDNGIRITKEDLPKVLKGDSGFQNRVSLSMILTDLNFLYDIPEGADD